MASLTYVTGVNASSSHTDYVRVGHNSSATNADAVWSFTPTQTGAKQITKLTFSFSWDNTTCGTGWSGSNTYIFAISTSRASGTTAASGTHLATKTASLSGNTGTTTVTISGLELTPGTTYYLRANYNGTTKSTMKCFAKAGNTYTVDAVSEYKVSVVYNANGGVQPDTNSRQLPWTTTIAYSATLNMLNYETLELTRSGYQRRDGAEWNTQSDGSGVSYDQDVTYASTDFAADVVSSDKTINVYAYWLPNTYTATFNKLGGSGGTDTLTANYDEAAGDIVPPTKIGYVFLGYALDSVDGTLWWDANGKSLVSKWTRLGDATLYAIWEAQGLVNIHDGTKYRKAISYINDGVSYKRAILWIHDGTKYRLGG